MNAKVIFLGDTHTLELLPKLVEISDLQNYTLIHVGDSGEGADYPYVEKSTLKYIHKYFQEINSRLYVCRGNHSNPDFFQKTHWANIEFGDRIEFVSDYDIKTIAGKTCQFVGGAISIDRVDKIENINWWPNEQFEYKPELAQKVDVLVTHSAPPYCPPEHFSKMVYDWAADDKTLLKDLRMERVLVGEILAICQPKLHVYGHFHNSTVKESNGCVHRQLAIDELWHADAFFAG